MAFERPARWCWPALRHQQFIELTYKVGSVLTAPLAHLHPSCQKSIPYTQPFLRRSSPNYSEVSRMHTEEGQKTIKMQSSLFVSVGGMARAAARQRIGGSGALCYSGKSTASALETLGSGERNHHHAQQRQVSITIWHPVTKARRYTVNRYSVDPYACLFYSSSSRQGKHPRTKKKPTVEDPFLVLGLLVKANKGKVIDISYARVKKRFLEIAMKHHPDTAGNDDDADKHRDTFIAARIAFETLCEGPDGLAILKSESEKYQKDYEEETNLNAWFKNETGHDIPFMDAETIKEVAEMTETVGMGGLDRDGGMWTLARMVTASARQGQSSGAAAVLQLEAGTSMTHQSINGILRRRRRR
jgi:hypothetical protein